MNSIMWRADDGSGLERCVLQATGEGWRLSGTTLLVSEDVPHEIRYSVQTDAAWRTTSVGVHVQSPFGDRRLALNADTSGSWFVGEEPILDLYGAIDVDLAWTPSTHTLPIRRLDLDVGETADVPLAWVGYPDHAIARLNRTYQRVDESTYRWTSPDRTVTFEVDELGRVTAYPGGWASVAATHRS